MSSNYGVEDCCNKGYRHEGTASGHYVNYNGIETYIVGEEHKENRVLLFLTDVLGNRFINTQLAADQFSENGFYVVMPDLFSGDEKPLNGEFNAEEWRTRHTQEITQPIVDRVVSHLLAEVPSSAKICVVGYCFGAFYTLELLSSQRFSAGAICHPSKFDIKLIEELKVPLFIGGAETDNSYNAEKRQLVEATLKSIGATYFSTLASGVSHGFCTRGDLSIPMVKFAKEKAFRDVCEWFHFFTK
jgi:dienelactone hydrolase